LRIIAVSTIRRGPGGADPFAAALVAAFLLGEALAQRFQELVEAAHGLDHLLFLLGEVFLREFFQPLGGNFDAEPSGAEFEALEDVAEDAVETVEIALVLAQRRARGI